LIEMAAATYNIDVIRGNTETILFRLKDGSDPFDLTGSTMVFRAQLGSVVIRDSTDDDMSMPTPADGEVTLTLTVEQTRSIPPGKAVPYELERRISGTEKTLLKGSLVPDGGVNDDA
jgi:hypothetical protein